LFTAGGELNVLLPPEGEANVRLSTEGALNSLLRSEGETDVLLLMEGALNVLSPPERGAFVLPVTEGALNVLRSAGATDVLREGALIVLPLPRAVVPRATGIALSRLPPIATLAPPPFPLETKPFVSFTPIPVKVFP
jgi:hypothetical protein